MSNFQTLSLGGNGCSKERSVSTIPRPSERWLAPGKRPPGVGLYLHVPFCARKCPYCDFYSVGYSKDAAEAYIAAVIRNMTRYRQEYGLIRVDTVFAGGGTPALLPLSFWGQIMQAAGHCFNIDSDAEITLETNPNLGTKERMLELKSAGFNRVSLGVQSMNPEELLHLGRQHTPHQGAAAVQNAFDAGFAEISADLMLGTIGQTMESLEDTIIRLTALPLTHVSAYMLQVEAGTPYAENPEITALIPCEEVTADLYLKAVELLTRRGFPQYEISNFAAPGHESRHNLHYWLCEEYIGIGPSAHSFFDGRRYEVPRSLEDFVKSSLQDEHVAQNDVGGFVEYAMLRLRLQEGLDLQECHYLFGIDHRVIAATAQVLEGLGLLTVDRWRIRLTPKGCLVSNAVIGRLFL